MSCLLHKHRLPQMLTPLLPPNPVIVEAGAFDGKDTKRLSAAWPQGEVHAFEPVPDIFTLLQASTHTCTNVFLHPYALSTTSGSELFYLSEHPARPHKPFQAGSLRKPKERYGWSPIRYTKTITVPTTTLDAWKDTHDIKTIDFLWLDVQGHALDILQASPNTVRSLTALFVEVEFVEAYQNQAQYRQVITWLINQGFTEVGRDFTNTTDWFFGNILFVREPILRASSSPI